MIVEVRSICLSSTAVVLSFPPRFSALMDLNIMVDEHPNMFSIFLYVFPLFFNRIIKFLISGEQCLPRPTKKIVFLIFIIKINNTYLNLLMTFLTS